MYKVPGTDEEKVLPLKQNNEILVDFDAIVDTDIGIYKYLLNEYHGSKYFTYLFNNVKDDSVLYELALYREDFNPIYAIKSDSMSNEEADELLKDILSKNDVYKQILDLSPINDIFKLMKMYRTSESGINVTVISRGDLESKIINTRAPHMFKIISETRDKIDTDMYNAYFVKFYPSILNYRKFMGNQVYVLEYKFNMSDYENKIPIRELSYILSDANTIKTVAPYSNPNLPKG